MILRPRIPKGCAPWLWDRTSNDFTLLGSFGITSVKFVSSRGSFSFLCTWCDRKGLWWLKSEPSVVPQFRGVTPLSGVGLGSLRMRLLKTNYTNLFSYSKSSDAIWVSQKYSPNKRWNLSYFQLCSSFWKLSKVLIGHNSENWSIYLLLYFA